MSCLKFGQIEVAFKDFQRKKQVTDILRIDVNKIELSDRKSCNNGKAWWYIVCYKVDKEMIIPLFINTPKIISSHGILEYNKNPAYIEFQSMFLR